MRARGWCVRGVCIEEMLQKCKSNAACRPVQAPVTCVIKQHMALFRLLLWLPGTPCVKGEGVCVCERESYLFIYLFWGCRHFSLIARSIVMLKSPGSAESLKESHRVCCNFSHVHVRDVHTRIAAVSRSKLGLDY